MPNIKTNYCAASIVEIHTPFNIENMLKDLIIDALKSNSQCLTASELKQSIETDASKSEINRQLYMLKSQQILYSTDSVPPKWHIISHGKDPSENKKSNEIEPLLHVIVDLGNCHDCLQNLISYAEKDLITVAAYADMAYSGFGVVPPLQNIKNLEVFQSQTSDKNSADVQLIWDLSRLVQRIAQEKPGRKLIIIVATKDLGFRSLQKIVQQNPDYTLIFVSNWESMRLHIE